jgi:hypothetical protein
MINRNGLAIFLFVSFPSPPPTKLVSSETWGLTCLAPCSLTCTREQANLLTGLVNLSVHSIYLLPLPAFFLLLSYALLIVLFAWSVRNTKISL